MIDIDEKNLKHGLLGLVIALVEVIRDALKLQAIRRIEGKSLTEEEVERLGSALADLDKAIEDMKEEQGVTEAVQNVRDGLDKIANDVVNTLVNPKELSQEIGNEKIKMSKAKEKLVMVEK